MENIAKVTNSKFVEHMYGSSNNRGILSIFELLSRLISDAQIFVKHAAAPMRGRFLLSEKKSIAREMPFECYVLRGSPKRMPRISFLHPLGFVANVRWMDVSLTLLGIIRRDFCRDFEYSKNFGKHFSAKKRCQV